MRRLQYISSALLVSAQGPHARSQSLLLLGPLTTTLDTLFYNEADHCPGLSLSVSCSTAAAEPDGTAASLPRAGYDQVTRHRAEQGKYFPPPEPCQLQVSGSNLEKVVSAFHPPPEIDKMRTSGSD